MKYHYNQPTAVGGEETEVSEFPWATLLLLRSSKSNLTTRCGGSLISDRWKLSKLLFVNVYLVTLMTIDTFSPRVTVSRNMRSMDKLRMSTMTSQLCLVSLH